ncbi:hypothetical protein B5X24_HaOG216679 [Helicoverpa armigera]|nr:hypothetical protein B5X24_HaOG216679 [Helicoverpa armigera]
MTTMEDLLATQQQIIEAIDKLYVNFKKDGAERKSPDYLRRRLENLEQYFTEFHNNHMNLLSFEDQSHSYFTSNQYDQTKHKFGNIKAAIQNYKPLLDRPQTPILKPSTFQSASTPQASSVSLSNPPLKVSSDAKTTEELLKKQATNFRAFAREAQDIDLNLISEKWEFEDILKTLKTRWTAIDSLHWELDHELNGSNAQYEEQFTSYEKYYKKLKRDINQKMWSVAHIEKSTPKIEIATFEGSYTDWVSFKDLFTETVHNNPSLSSAQKMQFLKSKVKGEPERLIQHLQISSSNYALCWDILNHRYDNKRRIFLSHLKNILNIPAIQQKSANHLKRIHDTTYESVNAIKNLGVDVSTWDPFIVCILAEKLDSETNDDYMDSLKSPRELPVLREFLQFLENKFMSLEISRKKQDNSKTSQPQNNHFNKDTHNYSKPTNHKFKQSYNNYSTNQVNTQSSKSKGKGSERRKSCKICKASDHRINNCPTLWKMQPSERKNTVANLNLCVNCLHYHEGRKCLSKIKCMECNEPHNTILHESFTSKNLTPDAARPGPSTATLTTSVSQQQEASSMVGVQNNPSEILLATAIVKAQSVDGSYQEMRVLLDQGSQTSIITERAAQLLRLPRKKCNGYISGIGNNESNCKADIQQFWEMEDIPEPLSISDEDQSCIEFFKASTSRRQDGSYVVMLPFKDNFEEKLGESKRKSVAQFFQIEKKLTRQPELARTIC